MAPASSFIVNPKPFLMDLTSRLVKVKLKWSGNLEYQGYLQSSDAYMNLQLTQTKEFIDGEFAGNLGEVLIRCNNILYVQALSAGEQVEAVAEKGEINEEE